MVFAHVLDLDPPLSLSESLSLLSDRVAEIVDPVSGQGVDMLRQQLPLLEALFNRTAMTAVGTRDPEDRALLTRTALQTHQAIARTVALLHGLELQRQGVGVVRLEP